jgi:hypothetical protein
MSLYALARVSRALFAVSVIFPIVGGLFVASPPPRWLGIADVGIAAALVGSTAAVVARVRRSVTADDRLSALRISQRVVGVVPVLLALYFVVGSRVNWTVLVIGLAWRAWLFLYSAPYLVAAFRAHDE